MYSLVETAKSQNLNIFEYIKYVLEQRPSESMTPEELETLLPWNEEVKERCRLK